MRDEKINQLKAELRLAGANSEEVSDLSNLALSLKQLKTGRAKSHIGTSKKQSRLRMLRPYFAGAFVLALLMLPIFVAQSAQPTGWLYPVQKLSDSVAVSVHPSYRASVMMKRSEQVNELVSDKAGTQVILATLNDYTNQAKQYKKMPHTSYAAMEYCETNLKQAAANASPEVRNAIHDSLESLES